MEEKGITALNALGLTDLEARIYVFTLHEAPVTGYRIAQSIGKPVANTYKAIKTLEEKGALMVDDGSSRMCRPVALKELMSTVEANFKANRNAAVSALQKIENRANDDRVYQLKTKDQVLERCREMLGVAREVVLLDLFPQPAKELSREIQAAARRKVNVAAKLYAPHVLKGVNTITAPNGADVIARWPGQWLNLVCDGKEHLLAFLDSESQNVFQAVWTGSAYLSWVYHSALSNEIVMSAIHNELRSETSVARIRKLIRKLESLSAEQAPGYRSLMQRFSR